MKSAPMVLSRLDLAITKSYIACETASCDWVYASWASLRSVSVLLPTS